MPVHGVVDFASNDLFADLVVFGVVVGSKSGGVVFDGRVDRSREICWFAVAVDSDGLAVGGNDDLYHGVDGKVIGPENVGGFDVWKHCRAREGVIASSRSLEVVGCAACGLGVTGVRIPPVGVGSKVGPTLIEHLSNGSNVVWFGVDVTGKDARKGR